VSVDDLPEWERLLAAERHLQALVPGAVLVGGTAAALHAGHRRSLDGDHVLEDLRSRFDDVLETLEAVAGWETSRVKRPVVILGRLDGMMTGVRQLHRSRPLETEVVSGLRVPTVAEMARIKAWLLVTRHTTRDYLDTVVLLERLGPEGVSRAFISFDELYPQPNGSSPLAEAIDRLALASPSDAPAVDLSTYKGLRAPWNDRSYLARRGRHWAAVLAGTLLGGVPLTRALERTLLTWNRSRVDLASDEILAQVLDRGDLAAWRELYALAARDADLRRRIAVLLGRVPLPYPGFWRAALASLGEPVDWTIPLPSDVGPA
jgi:hypothetical protein